MKIKNRLLINFLVIGIVTLFGACNDTDSSATPSSSSESGKRVFIATSTSLGNITVSGADTLCNSTALSGTYKAMIVGGGRVACTTADCSGGVGEHTDWVLAANTQYTRTNWTVIGTSDSKGLLPATLTNAISTAAVTVWTGLAADWTNSGNDCSSWTDATIGFSGNTGDASSVTTTTVIAGGGALTCDNNYKLICVEQ